MKPLNSLLAKYLLIVMSALVLLPFLFPLFSILLTLQIQMNGKGEAGLYQDGTNLVKMWHDEASQLDGAPDSKIDEVLRHIRSKYEKAGVFWVDREGRTRLQLGNKQGLPEQWTPSYTVGFMKERVDGDPFTVVAFFGGRADDGFMVLEVPRSAMAPVVYRVWDRNSIVLIAGTLLILILFLFISFLFFYRIRKRLVRLQSAMTAAAPSGIPAPVKTGREDEIGRLENAFNDMVLKLDRSRQRESEEEALRRDLIAKLSHDLRTPLTAIRGHAYSLQGEVTSPRGRESVEMIDRKIGYLSQLIENLFSYSLISSGKYPYRPASVDIVRLTRTLIANWYPAFELESFEINPDFPETAVYWDIDPEWLERILDNYFQNVLRHAKSGRYIGLRISSESGGSIAISDRGQGMGRDSPEKGAGIGLSIAALMMKDMKLRSEIESGSFGTTITILPRRLPTAGA